MLHEQSSRELNIDARDLSFSSVFLCAFSVDLCVISFSIAPLTFHRVTQRVRSSTWPVFSVFLCVSSVDLCVIAFFNSALNISQSDTEGTEFHRDCFLCVSLWLNSHNGACLHLTFNLLNSQINQGGAWNECDATHTSHLSCLRDCL